MELKITKEKVLEAASKCSQAKETLKTLFPEVFEDKYFKFTSQAIQFGDISCCIRNSGKYAHKGVWLNPQIKWEIVIDDAGEQVLLPTKK